MPGLSTVATPVGQRGPTKVPEPVRNIILVLDAFLDGLSAKRSFRAHRT